MKNYIRNAIKEKPEFRDFGAVDEEEHLLEIVEKQTEKDMQEIDPLFMGD